ncbi:MAG: PaREP1 family protein [Candidatus Scalindua sp.]
MKLNGKLKRYVALHEKYLKESEELYKQKNYSQVSEKLWGATATITKAIAASRNKTIKYHDGIGFYLASISKELKDESILNIVSIANSMHQNFYEDNLPPEVIHKASKTIKQFVKRMRSKFEI